MLEVLELAVLRLMVEEPVRRDVVVGRDRRAESRRLRRVGREVHEEFHVTEIVDGVQLGVASKPIAQASCGIRDSRHLDGERTGAQCGTRQRQPVR